MTTALVHPTTKHLPPEHQAKGEYVILTPEEQHAAFLSSQQVVVKQEENSEYSASVPYGVCGAPHEARRLMLKKPGTPVGMRDALLAAVLCLPTDVQHSLLKSLAAKHGYEME